MTKIKAINLMKKYATDEIDFSLALKISNAFGYNLSEICVEPKKVQVCVLSEKIALNCIGVNDSKVFDSKRNAYTFGENIFNRYNFITYTLTEEENGCSLNFSIRSFETVEYNRSEDITLKAVSVIEDLYKIIN